jgi:hypothetical protein
MRRFMFCLLAASLSGCGEFQAAMDAPPKENAAAPKAAAVPANVQPGQPAVVAPTAQPVEAAKPNGPIIGKTDGKIVDLVEAKKNPKVVEVDSKITGSDPLTTSFNAYVSITTKASVLAFKHQMELMKEVNGGKDYPPYKEAVQLMKQLKVEVASLPPWQMYGYDAKSGGLVLLEDKGEKIRLYKANNIPIEEGDKQYDMP